MLSNETSVEIYRGFSSNFCPGCGEERHEIAEGYLQECDRCLSKTDE